MSTQTRPLIEDAFAKKYGIRHDRAVLNERAKAGNAWLLEQLLAGKVTNGQIQRHVEQTNPDLNSDEIAYLVNMIKFPHSED